MVLHSCQPLRTIAATRVMNVLLEHCSSYQRNGGVVARHSQGSWRGLFWPRVQVLPLCQYDLSRCSSEDSLDEGDRLPS